MSARFRMDLNLAGYGVRLDVPTFDADRVHARYAAFEEPQRAPFLVEVAYDPANPIAQPEGVAYPQPRCTVRGGGFVFERRRERLEVDPSARRARLTIDRAEDAPRPSGAPYVESALRILLSLDLPARDGLLFHAAGAATPRGAVLFPAFGGGGKTTTARKLPHPLVLSDDQVALLRTPAGWVAHALPFVGLYGLPPARQHAPLRAIALLAKAAAPRLDAVRPAAAFARLLTCVVQYGPGADARVLALAESLAREVPVHELSLALDSPVEPWVAQLIA